MTDAPKNMVPVYLTKQVFVAGRNPQYTYNPRQARQVEEQVRRYLADAGKALIIDGPTKSGKTTLIERIIPDDGTSIWMYGQELTSMGDFWSRIISHLRISGDYTEATSAGRDELHGNATLAGIPKALSREYTETSREAKSETRTVRIIEPSEEVARLGLVDKPLPIVIDDFHYVPTSLKQPLARALKTVVRLTHIVLIAVPYDAFELVRQEPEMQGRVWRLQFPSWSEPELTEIATSGFKLLGLDDPGEAVAQHLARLSYSSPFILQQLCLDLVRWELNVVETGQRAEPIDLPQDLPRFLRLCADRTEPPVFARLLAGPRSKGTERQPIKMRDGVVTDIYGALMMTVKELLPAMEMTDRAIKLAMDRLCVTRVNVDRIANALSQISKIANSERGQSDPVLRMKEGKLYIVDPFFAFYLVHSSWSL